MKFTQEIEVTGLKRFKGNVEGVEYDSTKFYIKTDLDDSKGNAKGACTMEYTMGKSDEYDKYSHLTLPFVAVADMELVTNGKVSKLTLVSLKPKAVAQAARAA